MSNRQRLEYLLYAGSHEQYYEELFAADNFIRPATLGKADVWPLATEQNGEALPPDFLLNQFQRLLDTECGRPDFILDACSVPGWRVPFMDGRFVVFLFSTARTPNDGRWVEVKSATAGPMRG
ncbi:MAG TPA: hypothetical protein VE825_04775 [Terriglobales bacterium]|jgi:hypothetical protein|nr:hypothetical protein [Terriglobales bacterium]